MYTCRWAVAAGDSTWAVAAGGSSVRLRLPSFAEHPGQGSIKGEHVEEMASKPSWSQIMACV